MGIKAGRVGRADARQRRRTSSSSRSPCRSSTPRSCRSIRRPASRELELILDAAPLRALITRPRGGDGRETQPREPVRAGRRAAARRRQPPARRQDVPESRRRLQGTLLTCSVYKRPQPELGVRPDVVLFTADSRGDPKGVLRTDKNIEAAAEIIARALEIDKDTKILVAVPLFHAYGWDLGFLPALRHGATLFLEEEISAKRIVKLLREHDIDVLPGTPALYAELASCRPPRRSARRARATSPPAAPRRRRRRGVPRALRRAAPVRLPHDRDRRRSRSSSRRRCRRPSAR